MIVMDQQLTLKLFHRILGKEIVVTLIYAKCNDLERIKLLDSLYHLASDIDYIVLWEVILMSFWHKRRSMVDCLFMLVNSKTLHIVLILLFSMILPLKVVYIHGGMGDLMILAFSKGWTVS